MPEQVGVVGNGYWGKNLIRNYFELGALGGICDCRIEAERSSRTKYPNIPFYVDYGQLLAAPDISGVVLATPATTHYALARQALEAGKDVFVEKPLALRLCEASDLIELAAKRNRILMVGHILRYHPAVERLSRLIQSGGLGKLQYLYSHRLNMGKIRTEENILWSFAPHDISVILSLLSEEPGEVSCSGDCYLSDNIADVTLSELRFPSGVRSHIFVSWLHPFKEQRLVVIGSEKMAVFDDTAEQKLVLYSHRVEWKGRAPSAVKGEAEVVPLDSSEPLRNECRHFLDCIRSRQRPITDGEEGMRVLRVLDACQEALEKGIAVDVRKKRREPAQPPAFFAHPTAIIGDPAAIGAGTAIWHFSHVMTGAVIGERCNFGQNCHVAGGVVIGNNVKVQNNVSIYSGALIEDDVFLGPSCVLTNVPNPRSQVNRHSLYELTVVRKGATVGANATIVCGIELGRYSFVAAGAVVAKSVPDYALVVGNPATQVGWMSRHGHRLGKPDSEGIMTCPESGLRYQEVLPGVVRCIDLDEDTPLPSKMAVGATGYREVKAKAAASAKGGGA